MKKRFLKFWIFLTTLLVAFGPILSFPSPVGAFSATGGTITTSGSYTIHTFTSNGTFTPDSSGTVEYLVVGGGGGGGGVAASAYGAGSGGAGEFKTGTGLAVTAQAYSITVGAGGAGGAAGANNGSAGNSSIFSTLTAVGGGYGAKGNGSPYAAVNGGSGASGGGGSRTAGAGGSATAGNAGGAGYDGSPYQGGGGGGSGSAGANGSAGGAGGSGTSSSISGSAVTYAAGASGRAYTTDSNGANGAANTGDGGQGGTTNVTAHSGGNGGSGIVIIRYISTPPTAPTIGTPSALSTTSIRWAFTDNASDETGFKVYDTSNNLLVTCATANLTYCDETGLSVNTQYTRKVVAYSGAGNSSYSATATIYTLANAPSTPTVSSSGTTTSNVIVAVNSNPAATEFAIQETGSLNYVNKTTGALQASADWGTYANWGSGSGITVTGLSVNAQYTYKVKARNGDNTETAFSSTAAAYTRAAIPPAPTVALRARATPTRQNVTPAVGSNPSGTEVAIYKEAGTTCDGSGGTYVATDGSDNGATAAWQTVALWGTKTVTSLSPDRQYSFCIIARNGDSIATSAGTSAAYNSCIPSFSGDHTITQDCSFLGFTDGNNAARKVHGLDTGTGSGQDSNTSTLTIQSGILTVNADETIAAGKFVLTGGSIAIATGGVLKVGMPLWAVDADADGIPADAKLYAQLTAPTNGRRRSLMTRIRDCDAYTPTPNGCYGKNITITYSGSTLTNYDIVFTVDTATPISQGKMQGDCGDIRVKDSDGTTNLTYWIESGCNTTSTQIWARVPSIPNGGKTISIQYHGESVANGFESWSGSFTLLYNTTCPTGWTQNADFNSRFPYGASTYGTTGGASSHSHAQVSCTTGTGSSQNTRSGTTNSVSTGTNTHTAAKVDISTASNVLPPYLDVLMCKKADLVIPASFIALFDTTVPSGWTRFSTLDNTFPRGATTYGGTGGATTHSHSTTGGYTTGSSGLGLAVSLLTNFNSIGDHTHVSSNGTTDTGTNTPPYLDMIFGQANAQTTGTAGLIAITDVVPPLGWTRFTALDSYLPRGSATYGGTGGATTHTHSVTVSVAASTAATVLADNRVNSPTANLNTHTHSCSATTDSQSNLPPYINTIFVKRNSPTPTTAVGSEFPI